jgi:hypothetical protein
VLCLYCFDLCDDTPGFASKRSFQNWSADPRSGQPPFMRTTERAHSPVRCASGCIFLTVGSDCADYVLNHLRLYLLLTTFSRTRFPFRRDDTRVFVPRRYIPLDFFLDFFLGRFTIAHELYQLSHGGLPAGPLEGGTVRGACNLVLYDRAASIGPGLLWVHPVGVSLLVLFVLF